MMSEQEVVQHMIAFVEQKERQIASNKLASAAQGSADDQQFLLTFWTLVANHVTEWQEVLDKSLTKKALRENYIVALAITISAFGKLGRFFYDNNSYDMTQYLVNLRRIDWLRTNPDWVGRTIRENGKVLNSEEAITLTCSKIKQLIGVPLNREEKQKEKQLTEKM